MGVVEDIESMIRLCEERIAYASNPENAIGKGYWAMMRSALDCGVLTIDYATRSGLLDSYSGTTMTLAFMSDDESRWEHFCRLRGLDIGSCQLLDPMHEFHLTVREYIELDIKGIFAE
jgi:hypothetical protein